MKELIAMHRFLWKIKKFVFYGFFFFNFSMHFWEKKIATIYLYLHNQYVDCCIELLTRFDLNDYNIMNLIRLKFYKFNGTYIIFNILRMNKVRVLGPWMAEFGGSTKRFEWLFGTWSLASCKICVWIVSRNARKVLLVNGMQTHDSLFSLYA